MTEQVKLYVFAEGKDAYEFLEDVRMTLEMMEASWKTEPDREFTVTVGGGGVQHGW